MGRRAELDLLSALATQAREGHHRLALLEGEPGIGKTSLVSQVLAGLDDFTVLEVAGEESEVSLQYGVASQLLAQLPARLLHHVPLLSAQASGLISTFAVGAGLLRALGELTQLSESPIALFIDDLQWVDTSSTAALTFAARRLRPHRVLVLATARCGAQQPVLDRRWERLLRHGSRLTMAGLDCDEVVALAARLNGADLSRAAGERLRAHTGGHPLHTGALLTELPRHTLLEPSEPLPAPRSVVASVRRRAATLSADARALLNAQAVLGRPGPLSTTARLGGVQHPTAALEEAEGFLSWSPSPMTTIAFRHPLLRAAIYGELAPSRRRSLHAEAARLVEHRATWRHRVAAAEGPDPLLAAELASAADVETAHGRPAVAATLLLWASALSATRRYREARLLAAATRMIADEDGERALLLLPAIESCADGPLRTSVLGQLASLTAGSERLYRLRRAADSVAAAGLAEVPRLDTRGAPPHVAARDTERPKYGGEVPVPRSRDPLGLTGRERQVAQLVARGLTNREAAAELHVTPKTIDFHLGRIYAKLCLESRRQLRDLIYPPSSNPEETRHFA